MWKESDKKLVVHLDPSLTLSVLLVLMHVGAWASLLLVPLELYVKAPLVVAVGVSLRRTLAAHGLRRGTNAVLALELQESEIAARFDGSPAWTPAGSAGAFVHPLLVALRLRIDGRRWPVNVVVLRGATDSESFRALRVCLNAGVTSGKAAAGAN